MNKEKKVLFVTGASSDIGSVLITDIAVNYDVIWAHYCRSSKRIEELQSVFGKKIIPVHADFSDEESVLNLIDQVEKSGQYPHHIVHLSAQRTENLQFHKSTWDAYQTGIDTSLRSIVMILQVFIPQMVKRHYGKIVFLLTSYVLGVPPKYQSPYITAKYAQYGLMKCLAAEYAEKGISVNGVSPDMIETKFLDNIPKLLIRQNAEQSPLKRNLSVHDVIPAFRYLLSEEVVAVTGHNLSITGGMR